MAGARPKRDRVAKSKTNQSTGSSKPKGDAKGDAKGDSYDEPIVTSDVVVGIGEKNVPTTAAGGTNNGDIMGKNTSAGIAGSKELAKVAGDAVDKNGTVGVAATDKSSDAVVDAVDSAAVEKNTSAGVVGSKESAKVAGDAVGKNGTVGVTATEKSSDAVVNAVDSASVPISNVAGSVSGKKMGNIAGDVADGVTLADAASNANSTGSNVIQQLNEIAKGSRKLSASSVQEAEISVAEEEKKLASQTDVGKKNPPAVELVHADEPDGEVVVLEKKKLL